MKLTIIRHGKSIRERMNYFGRRHNFGLDHDYDYLIVARARNLKGRRFDAVFSSPLRRCVETLDVAGFGLAPTSIVEEFTAYHSGHFEDKTIDYVNSVDPTYTTRSFRDRFVHPNYGEESIYEQTERIRRGLDRLLSECIAHGHDHVLLCAHFSTINVLFNLLSGNPDVASYAEGKIDVKEGGYATFAPRTDGRFAICDQTAADELAQ